MIVQCETCRMYFEDEFRTYVCPHDVFLANNGDNTFALHYGAYLSDVPDVDIMAEEEQNEAAS